MTLGIAPAALDAAIACAEQLFDRAAAGIRPATGGAGAGEAMQVPLYELAFTRAELSAARVLARYAVDHGGSDPLAADLAALFIAESVYAAHGRIAQRPADFGLARADLDELCPVAQLDALQALRGADFLESVGARLIDRNGDLGPDGLDDEKQLMRATFRRFADEQVRPRAQAIHREDRLVPDDIIDGLGAMGCFGLSIPERFGGLQPDDAEDSIGMIVATEELSRGSLGAAGSLITRPEILSRALLEGGTDAQRAKWLPSVAAGRTLVAISVTEPNTGSDVASVALRAVRDGDGWRLSGGKTWCTFAGKADVMFVLARTDPDRRLGHRGLSLFLVEKPRTDGDAFEFTGPRGGTVAGRAIATIGYRGMHSFEIAYDDFWVPHDNLVGADAGVNRGFYYTMRGFSGGRIQTAARATGLMQAAMEQAIAYARERVVFGQPIAAFQLTRAKIARMGALALAARQFSYAVGRMMDAGGGQMEASLVKLHACKAAEWVCREAMQVHGGFGYAEEAPVSRLFVDARVLSIFEGAEETLALKVVGRALLEQARGRNER